MIIVVHGSGHGRQIIGRIDKDPCFNISVSLIVVATALKALTMRICDRCVMASISPGSENEGDRRTLFTGR